LYQLAISGGLSLGALWMGFITDRFSISTALLVNGLLALLFQILIFGLQVKHIRQFTSADKSN
ncbi:MAG TPA: hypothetical protein VNZ86_06150, partial [Bacteroidia bacterium]|nr:hypothetical protein [Bacteroidia bacterium]